MKIDVEHVRAIRERELAGVVPFFPAGAAVLEIGAGAGWQAKALSALGFNVEAIDVPDSNYVETRVWPVQAYDGTHIPFEDARFDVVFSSNVLEHVKDLEGLEKEIHRTLKPGGTVIHVLPTPAWRAWTTLAHYPTYATLIGTRLATSRAEMPSSAAEPANTSRASTRPATGRHGVAGLLRSIAVPARHGEIGNALSELYHFSSLRWRSHFQRSGWRVEQELASRVFYTGYSLFGQALSLEKRSRLSAVLGSACTAYVLRSAR